MSPAILVSSDFLRLQKGSFLRSKKEQLRFLLVHREPEDAIIVNIYACADVIAVDSFVGTVSDGKLQQRNTDYDDDYIARGILLHISQVVSGIIEKELSEASHDEPHNFMVSFKISED